MARENGHEDLVSLLLKHMKSEVATNGEKATTELEEGEQLQSVTTAS